jgi:formylglycine-generating enzyme required for sulfatase activity
MTEKPVQPGEGRGNQKDQLIYVWIPKGEFQMGCVKDDTECQEDEKPQHPVTISKGFWISNSEVTLSAYQLFLDANPGHPQPPKTQTNRGDLTTDAPRTNVSWQDAQDYCKWAGGSLPSEAQWEYAARGGVAGQIYPWGNTSDPKQPQANYFGAVKSRALKNFYETTPVHRYPKNSWNLFDMAGNVREWVADSYNPEAYQAAGPFVDPLDGSAGKEHVVRGGSWNSRAQLLRNSARGHVKVDHDNQTGFRCVVPVL